MDEARPELSVPASPAGKGSGWILSCSNRSSVGSNRQLFLAGCASRLLYNSVEGLFLRSSVMPDFVGYNLRQMMVYDPASLVVNIVLM